MTSKQVVKGIHCIPAENGEQLLSKETCKLIEISAGVTGHSIPL